MNQMMKGKRTGIVLMNHKNKEKFQNRLQVSLLHSHTNRSNTDKITYFINILKEV